ncbi:MAG: transposase [Christensenellaceae bacterium]|nr:transposase [Christensenellaceae bacterium]
MGEPYYTYYTNPKSKTVYVYEAVCYYDHKTKRSQYSRRTLIGHVDKITGEIVKNREWHKKDTPGESPTLLGANYVVSEIAEALNLKEDLKALAPEDYDNILALATCFLFNKSGVSVDIEFWKRFNYLEPDMSLNSQRISELYERLSHLDLEPFFELRMKEINEARLYFDSTSLNSHSENIELDKCGKSEDEVSLPQINLAILLNSETELPVWFEEFPGNVVDVSLKKHLMRQTEYYHIEKLSLCLDRGFDSKSNIETMLSEQFKFIIGLISSTEKVKPLIKEHACATRDQTNYDARTNAYCMQVDYPITISYRNPDNTSVTQTAILKANLYYSVERYRDELNAFNKNFEELKSHLDDVKPEKKLEMLIKKYFIKTSEGYQINKQVVQEEVEHFGFFAILSSENNLTAKEVLEIYRSKDAIEKVFSIVKSDLDFLTTKVRNIETLRGKLLCIFTALILRAEIIKRLRKAALPAKDTLERALNVLAMINGKIKKNGTFTYRKPTKRQSDYLNALKIPFTNDP